MGTPTQSAGPDELSLAADTSNPMFTSRAERGWWTVHAVDGAVMTVTVHGRLVDVTLRIECDGYPGQPPTAAVWDRTLNQPLPASAWPVGGQATQVFNPGWAASFGGALYWPFDRKAIVGHDAWRTDHPGHVWGATTTVIDYLTAVRTVLATATGPLRSGLHA